MMGRGGSGMWAMRVRRSDEGAVAVEFALVIPVLLLLLFGIVDFGRLLYVKNALVYATADGARAAALHSTTVGSNETQTAVAIVTAAAASMNITSVSGQGTAVTVPTTPASKFKLCPPDTSAAVESATAIVSASIPFKWFSPATMLPIASGINSLSVTSTWLCVKTT